MPYHLVCTQRHQCHCRPCLQLAHSTLLLSLGMHDHAVEQEAIKTNKAMDLIVVSGLGKSLMIADKPTGNAPLPSAGVVYNKICTLHRTILNIAWAGMDSRSLGQHSPWDTQSTQQTRCLTD